MEIKTKFNINQEVYFLLDNKVIKAEVTRIDATVSNTGRAWTTYEVRALSQQSVGQLYPNKNESFLFASKAELLASL
jgi:hypothetical protein